MAKNKTPPLDLQSAVDEVLSAIRQNPRCMTGMAIQPFVVAAGQGPSGGLELLAFIHSTYGNDCEPIYWYVHLLPHPSRPPRFVALLIKSEVSLMHLRCAATLLSQYDLLVVKGGCPTHCPAFQSEGETSQEVESFEEGIDAVQHLIRCFDEKYRHPAFEDETGEISDLYTESFSDVRSIEIYGSPSPKPRIPRMRVIPKDLCEDQKESLCASSGSARIRLAGAMCLRISDPDCPLHPSSCRNPGTTEAASTYGDGAKESQSLVISSPDQTPSENQNNSATPCSFSCSYGQSDAHEADETESPKAEDSRSAKAFSDPRFELVDGNQSGPYDPRTDGYRTCRHPQGKTA